VTESMRGLWGREPRHWQGGRALCSELVRIKIGYKGLKITKGVFGLRNYYIQIKVVHHEFIPQIWWNNLIPYFSTNYEE
jgi:hypothetical protein